MGKELDDILRTLEYIKGLTHQGKKEMAHMWNYISTFGFYIFLGSFVESFLNEGRIWIWAFPFALFFSTGPSLGWLKSLFTWSLLSVLVLLFLKFLSGGLLFIFIVVLLFFLGFLFLYGTSSRRVKKVPFTVAPRLGVFWVILIAGVFINLYSLSSVQNIKIGVIQNIFWPFSTGIGYLITGFFTSWEFIVIGLLAIFIIPIVFYFLPQLTLAFYGILGLLIGLVAIKLRISLRS